MPEAQTGAEVGSRAKSAASLEASEHGARIRGTVSTMVNRHFGCRGRFFCGCDIGRPPLVYPPLQGTELAVAELTGMLLPQQSEEFYNR